MVKDEWKRCPKGDGCGGSGVKNGKNCEICGGRGGWHACKDCGQQVVNDSCGCPDSL